MIVRLTNSELFVAHTVAGMRIAFSFKAHLRDKFDNGDEGRGSDYHHVRGARGEIAVAKAFNLYWPPAFGEFDRVDVGDCLQVRTVDTAFKPLTIRARDKDKCPFVLVDASACPIMRLVGWIMPADARRDEWKADPNGSKSPAHFVPRDALLDMATCPVVHARLETESE